jgi:hypothetical protein
MSAFANVIQWYESKELDNPELRSPTPCPRGVYCQYKLPNKETKELELACCRMVHPGEEGNGRRLFPARTAPDGREQQACVRLTGKAGFYERCRLKQPWRVWAAEHEIPLPPADVPWVQVVRGPIRRTPQEEINQHSRRVMRMRMRGGAGEEAADDYSDPLNAQGQQARIGAVLARNEVARAMVAVSRAGREVEAAKPVSATPSSAADWPALPYRVCPPPSIDLKAAVRNFSAIPATMMSAEAPSPQLCSAPPRLNLSGGCPSYGFTAAESMRPPPHIQRLRSDRLYEHNQQDGCSASPSLGGGLIPPPCATPSLLGSVDDDDGSATPSLIPYRTRSQRINDKIPQFLSIGASLEEATTAATNAVDAEIAAEGAEGAMEGVD